MDGEVLFFIFFISFFFHFSFFLIYFFKQTSELFLDQPSQLIYVRVTFIWFNFKSELVKESSREVFSINFIFFFNFIHIFFLLVSQIIFGLTKLLVNIGKTFIRFNFKLIIGRFFLLISSFPSNLSLIYIYIYIYIYQPYCFWII